MKPFEKKGWRIAALVVRMLLGVLFIVSAVAKWLDIDHFELYVFSFNVLTLNLSFLVARLVIVAEALIGIGLIANIWKKFVDTCTMLMLVCFTLFLGYAAIAGRTDNCHCFGSLIQFDPTQSILKNAVLLVLLLFAMGSRPWKWRPRWFVWVPVVLVITVGLFINSAPDNWLFGPEEEVYNKEELNKSIEADGELQSLDLTQGRHLVAFVTPTCPFCQMADEKLTHICSRHDLDSTAFIYLSPRTDSTIVSMTLDRKSFIHPSYLIDVMTWSMITYGQRPLIFLLKDGKVEETFNYRNINEKRIVEFLQ